MFVCRSSNFRMLHRTPMTADNQLREQRHFGSLPESVFHFTAYQSLTTNRIKTIKFNYLADIQVAYV